MNEYINKLITIIQTGDGNFDGLMIVNNQGIVEYHKLFGRLNNSDMPNFTEYTTGKNFLELYPELNENNSTVMQTLKSGCTTVGVRQTLTWKNYRLEILSTTYPIIENGIIRGAADAIKLLALKNLKTGEFIKQNFYVTDDIITQNPAMEELKKKIMKASESNSPAFIQGETGTGKELIAESLHSSGPRRTKEFIAQNCAAIPANLLESMFFGTEKGAFTGAESRSGLFEMADGGTLFLDEINSMDMVMQAKLLKVIEEKKVRRIGGSKDIVFDVRLISASNEPVDKLFSENKLRRDLYYRLNVINFEIPPLRERPEDIPLLTDYFICLYNKSMHKNIKGLSIMVKEVFSQWTWPGNVRELRNTIESAFNIEQSDYIGLESIRELFKYKKIDSPERFSPDNIETVLKTSSVDKQTLDLETMLRDYERGVINSVLERERTLADAARILSISPQKLQYRMKVLGIKKN